MSNQRHSGWNSWISIPRAVLYFACKFSASIFFFLGLTAVILVGGFLFLAMTGAFTGFLILIGHALVRGWNELIASLPAWVPTSIIFWSVFPVVALGMLYLMLFANSEEDDDDEYSSPPRRGRTIVTAAEAKRAALEQLRRSRPQ
jgi:hypothetical protein